MKYLFKLLYIIMYFIWHVKLPPKDELGEDFRWDNFYLWLALLLPISVFYYFVARYLNG